jgi:cysteine-rich repeat protein
LATPAVRITTARIAVTACLLCGVLLLALSPAQAQQRHKAREILVKYSPGLSKSEIAETNRLHGTRILEVIPELGIYRLSIPDNATVDAMAAEFSNDPKCKDVEPNYIGEGGDFIPNDGSFKRQWHLHNTGQFGGAEDADIDAVEGWQITRGDASIIVAVLDSGIAFDHPEFVGRTLPGFDFVNEDADPEDDESHGTLVTGLLAANSDNDLSVAGVDHFTQILPVKVLNAENSGTVSDLVQGLVFAADEGASVINMSLIGYGRSSFLEDALQFARDSGAILIACAGNGGIGDADISGPGVSPLTISVGATTLSDERAGFSGTGRALDVVAPGSGVLTVSFTGAHGGSWFGGCSAATPIVSGISSLLLSLDPLLTHDQVHEILAQSADDLVGPPLEDTPGRDDFFGHGRVNMNQALALVTPMVVCGNGVLDPGEECDDGNVEAGDGCSPICQLEGEDSDGDGVPDAEDACPDSMLDPTVVIDGCDSEVSNTLLSGGCTISDKVDECAANSRNHGAFRRCVSKLGDKLQKDGVLTGPEKERILSCAGQADIP